MKRLARLLATGLYSGYFPIAPGTVGSAVALIPLFLCPAFKGFYLLLLSFILFFIGVWSATEVEKTDGRDASIINIDEIVGMWLSVLYLPEGLHWWWLIMAFFVFRIFDIIKPPPVNASQRIPGGWGVMIDDVLAGIYTNLFLRILLYIFY